MRIVEFDLHVPEAGMRMVRNYSVIFMAISGLDRIESFLSYFCSFIYLSSLSFWLLCAESGRPEDRKTGRTYDIYNVRVK